MKMGDKRGPEGYYNHVIYSCMYGYKWQAKIWIPISWNDILDTSSVWTDCPKQVFLMKHIKMNEIIGIFTKFFHSFRRNEFDTAGAVEKSGGRRKVKFLPSLCFQLQI